MELTYDWSNFRETFRSRAVSSPKLVALHGKIVALTGPCNPVSGGWIGKSVESFKHAHSDQKVQVFEGEKVEHWVADSMGIELNHMYEQVTKIQPQCEPQYAIDAHPHFLLKAFESNWAKVFPSSFGILIRLSDVSDSLSRDFFVILKQGRLSLFHRPELSTLGAARADVLSEVVKYLSEKHSIPVQAVHLTQSEWSELSQGAQPWKDLASMIKSKRAELVPFRWGVLAWIATRAVFKS